MDTGRKMGRIGKQGQDKGWRDGLEGEMLAAQREGLSSIPQNPSWKLSILFLGSREEETDRLTDKHRQGDLAVLGIQQGSGFPQSCMCRSYFLFKAHYVA